MYKRRNTKTIKLDEQRHYGELQDSKARNSAKEAFKHKPYQSTHTSGGGAKDIRLEMAAVDKKVIYEYEDAKMLIKETEKDIKNHKRTRTVQDKVKGSNPEFPYQGQSFNISGRISTYLSEKDIDEEEKILEERRAKASELKLMAEKVMNAAPMRIQRIIRFKVMKGMTWEETAEKMKAKSGESIRKEFRKWMDEK